MVGQIEQTVVVRFMTQLGNKFARGMSTAQNSVKGFGQEMQRAGHMMAMPVKNLSKGSMIIDTFGTRAMRATKGLRVLTHGMRGFRMEALGVMFFGMMLQRAFMGLLNPVMEAFGVFDLFSLMLLVVFLPVMEMLFPFFLKFIEFFLNLPEPVKKAIGAFVIIMAVVGALLFIFGSLILGIGSLILMFAGPLSAVLIAVGVTIVSFGLIFIAVIAVILLLVYGMYLAWQENFMGMRQIVSNVLEAIKKMFSGVFNIIMGIVKFFVAVFTGDFQGAKDAVIQIFNGLLEFYEGFREAMINVTIAITIGIIKLFTGMITTIEDAFIAMLAWIDGKTGGVLGKVGSFLAGGLNSNKVEDFILQPGGRLIETDPRDTIVGYKGDGGPGGGANITNIFNGFTMEELKRELDDRDRRMVSAIERNK